ncbi:MAG: hypothetical protein RIS64_2333 [Bacteroidota bacterium]|jgi:hypothetical protein
MENLPIYIHLVFVLTVLLSVWLFYKAANRSNSVLIVLFSWLGIQAVISLLGFYQNSYAMPPRFGFLVLPPVILIITLFVTEKGKQIIDSFDMKMLTIFHIVRIPIEIVLFWLFLNKTVPALMTFEGRNFDILSGLTAPFIYYFGFVKQNLSRNVLLSWNFICIGLLINIVANAALSIASPFQQFGFEQPNIAVLHFPFVWLPGCLVPMVLLAHLVTIRHIFLKR